MKNYLNPTINIEKFDVENIVTTSTAVAQAQEKLAEVGISTQNILTLE